MQTKSQDVHGAVTEPSSPTNVHQMETTWRNQLRGNGAERALSRTRSRATLGASRASSPGNQRSSKSPMPGSSATAGVQEYDASRVIDQSAPAAAFVPRPIPSARSLVGSPPPPPPPPPGVPPAEAARVQRVVDLVQAATAAALAAVQSLPYAAGTSGSGSGNGSAEASTAGLITPRTGAESIATAAAAAGGTVEPADVAHMGPRAVAAAAALKRLQAKQASAAGGATTDTAEEAVIREQNAPLVEAAVNNALKNMGLAGAGSTTRGRKARTSGGSAGSGAELTEELERIKAEHTAELKKLNAMYEVSGR